MYSTDLRSLVVRLYLSKIKSLRKLAAFIECASKSTIQRWLKQSPLVQRADRRKKMSNDVVDVINECLSKDAYTTRSDIVNAIRKTCRKCVSKSSVGRVIHKTIKYSRKRTHRRVCKEGLSEKKLEFSRNLSTIQQENVISIDETAIWFDMKPYYGWAPRGQRLVAKVHNKKQSKWTLLMAVSNNRVIGYHIFKGNCNACIFKDFVDTLDTSAHSHLLMDNVAFHKTASVRKGLELKGIEPLYLSPYSPEFQPIENTFSALKSYYRSMPCEEDMIGSERTEESVFMRVAASIAMINDRDLHNTFAKCWKVAERCVQNGSNNYVVIE